MAHANRAYLVRRKAPVGSNSRRGHPGSRQSDLSSAVEKRKPPRRAAGEVAALLGAEMGRDVPQGASKASVPRANEKGRHACAVLGVRVSALAWPTPARDSPLCLGAL